MWTDRFGNDTDEADREIEKAHLSENQISRVRERRIEVAFSLWVLVCLFCSMEIAGRLGHVVLEKLMSLLQSGPTNATGPGQISWFLRKSIHVGLFSVLGGLGGASRGSGSSKVILTIGFCICLLAELIQRFESGRSAELSDAVINVVAFGIGFMLLRVSRSRVLRSFASGLYSGWSLGE